MMIRKAKAASLLTASLLAIAAVPGYAQTATEAQTETPAKVDSIDYSDSDIVVTARKREESLQNVPVAVTAFGGETLRDKNVTAFYDLPTQTPGLQVRTAGSQRSAPDFFIRGQGSTFGTAAGVSLYFANAPAFDSFLGTNIQFYDLASLQVLKGPQGTLFGRATTGGAVLVDPKRPTDSFEGYLEGTIGSYNQRELTGAINIPIVADHIAFRAAGSIVRRDGFTTNLSNGQDLDNKRNESYRLGLTIKPGDGFETYFLFSGQHFNENGSGAVLLDYNRNLPNFNTGPTGAGRATVNAICTATNPVNLVARASCVSQRIGLIDQLVSGYAVETTRLATGGDAAKRKNQASGLQFHTGSVQTLQNVTTISPGSLGFLGDITIKNIFSTHRTRGAATGRSIGGSQFNNAVTYNGVDLINNIPTVTDKSGDTKFFDRYSEEFQIGGDRQGFNWLVGYYREQYERPFQFSPIFNTFNLAFTTPLGALPTTGSITLNSRAVDQGFFGQTTFEVLPRLNVTAGYRHSMGERTSQNAVPVRTVDGFTAPVVRETTPYSEKADSYNFSVDYKPIDNLLLYVSHRKGYKPGGVNAVPSATVPGYRSSFSPETLKDVELGGKYTWDTAGIRGRSNIAVYRQWYSNIQRNEVLPIPGGTSVFTQVNNIAAADIQGFEFENSLTFGRLTLTANYAFTDAKYKTYPGTVTDINGVVHNLIDSPFIGTPKHQGTLGLRYDAISDPDIGEISVSGDFYMQSEVVLDDQLLKDPRRLGIQPGYENVNLRIDWKGIGGKGIDAAVFVRNVTNDLHLVSVGNLIDSLGALSGIYNEPRVWGAQLRFSW